jgi:hypothetical protein
MSDPFVPVVEVLESAIDTVEVIDQPAINIYTSGEAPFRYVHAQVIPALVWTIQHNLGSRPGGILIIGTNGEEVEGHITQVNDNAILVTFFDPTSGTAYVS